MSRIFLMSPPGPTWRIRGGKNFRSQARSATSARRAGEEWLALATAMSEGGATIAVMPPPAASPPLTGMVYTANAGALFSRSFLVSKMGVEHRLAEADPIATYVTRLGLEVSRASAAWEGQAEICTLPGRRYLLSFGVRSAPESVVAVRALLPEGAKILTVRLREPFFHGDTCLNALTTARGTLLLACEAAFVDRTIADLRAFAPDIEVVPVSEADARAYACNGLALAGRFLVPRGLSAELRLSIEGAGLTFAELEMDELFGKGGGGPRCLVNELFGLTEIPEAMTFAEARAELSQAIAAYPETTEEMTP